MAMALALGAAVWAFSLPGATLLEACARTHAAPAPQLCATENLQKYPAGTRPMLCPADRPMPKGYRLATGADVAPWRDYAVKALGEWGIAKLDGGMKIDGSSYGGQVSKHGEDEELGHLLVVKLAGSPGTPGGSVGKEGSTFAVQLLRRSFQTHPEEYVTRVLMMVCSLSAAEAALLATQDSDDAVRVGTWERAIAEHTYEGLMTNGVLADLVPDDRERAAARHR